MKKILIKAFIIINVIFLYGCDEGSKSSSSDYQKRLDKERANTLNDIRNGVEEAKYQEYKRNH